MNEILKHELADAEEWKEILEPFGIANDDEANKTFRKLRAVKRLKAEKEEMAKKEYERIDNWLNKEVSSLNNTIEYFNGQLFAYLKWKQQSNPKYKLSTPNGKVIIKKSKKWNYDEESLLPYLYKNEPRLVKIETSIDKVELKKLYKDGVNQETGEVLPGIEIVEEESFSVKEVE